MSTRAVRWPWYPATAAKVAAAALLAGVALVPAACSDSGTVSNAEGGAAIGQAPVRDPGGKTPVKLERKGKFDMVKGGKTAPRKK